MTPFPPRRHWCGWKNEIGKERPARMGERHRPSVRPSVSVVVFVRSSYILHFVESLLLLNLRFAHVVRFSKEKTHEKLYTAKTKKIQQRQQGALSPLSMALFGRWLLLLFWILSRTELQAAAAAVATTTTTTTEEEDNCPNSSSTNTKTDTTMASNKYQQDGPEAKEIAQYLPYFPFKGIPRFYDIGGLMKEPKVFQKVVDIFVERYKELEIDVVAGLDARGFVLGPPIALAMEKPFVMMRKKGKMPNSISSDGYNTEYGTRAGLTVQRDAFQEGDRVLIIDDLVATGGTLSSAISLVKMLKAKPIECACIVELKMFIDPPEASGLPSRIKLFQGLGHQDVPVWGLISEDVLTNEATLHKDYVDDGEEH